MKFITFLAFFISLGAEAAGGGAGHITDLIVPAINFSVVFFGLYFST